MNSKKSREQDQPYQRKCDPYLDRRSGEDRRKIYSLVYFNKGNKDRRVSDERRFNYERRENCVRVSQWSSVCLDKDELRDLSS